MLKKLALFLIKRKDAFYDLSYRTGATKVDRRKDVDREYNPQGGRRIGVNFSTGEVLNGDQLMNMVANEVSEKLADRDIARQFKVPADQCSKQSYLHHIGYLNSSDMHSMAVLATPMPVYMLQQITCFHTLLHGICGLCLFLSRCKAVAVQHVPAAIAANCTIKIELNLPKKN